MPYIPSSTTQILHGQGLGNNTLNAADNPTVCKRARRPAAAARPPAGTTINGSLGARWIIWSLAGATGLLGCRTGAAKAGFFAVLEMRPVPLLPYRHELRRP